MPRVNEFGQPIGDDLDGWESPVLPSRKVLTGRNVRLEPLDWSEHGSGLMEAFSGAPDSLWTYMPFGPFEAPDGLKAAIQWIGRQDGWVPYAMIADHSPMGFASYLRIEPADGVIEVGSIVLAPSLQRTTPATEALYLLMRHAFELGYRRLEWKCDDLNQESRRAALRLGFRYEGTFRQATHYKGRNRDTAWFAITADRWAHLDAAFQDWLSSTNFDDHGGQIRTLEEFVETRSDESS